MATVVGQRTTANLADIQRKNDLMRKVLKLEPDAAPLTKILRQSKGNRKVTNNSTFQWAEVGRPGVFDAVNNSGGYDSDDTSIIVDTGSMFKAGTMFKIPRTGEIISVSSVSTNTLTVARGAAGTTAAAIVDNDPIYILGQAIEEGTGSVDAISQDPVAKTNYTQIFKRSVEISGTAGAETNELDPHDWQLQHELQAIEHQVDMEKAALYGAPSTGTGTNSKPLRFTGGIEHFCTENRVDAGGTLTEAEVETFCRGIFRYGSKKKTLFASALLVSVLNQFSQSKIQTQVGDDTFGVNVVRWISPHGKLNIVTHHLLEGATWGGYGFALDFGRGAVAYRYLGGGPLGDRDTALKRNVQDPDQDGQKDQWITEAGFQVAEAKTHGVLYGVTG